LVYIGVSVVPSFDLTRQFQKLEAEVGQAVSEVLVSGRYIGGTLVEGFEHQFTHYIQTEACVACNSGTDALYLALRALGIGAGDEVITTPFTFVATAEVITAVGATPVFVDIHPQTLNLDVDQLASQITPRTRAIIPVHLFGHAVDMTRLMAIAQQHQLWVIEDCAQATGAAWHGQKVGSIGHVGCFSFFPTKNLGACGDGGAITTNDRALETKLRQLREHGQGQRRYYYEQLGVNSRLDALQAAILQVKLNYLETWNTQRAAIAQQYQTLLHDVAHLVLPRENDGETSVWNQYTVQLIPPDASVWEGGDFRDRVQQHLREMGITTTVYYPVPLHLQPVYQPLGYQPGQLPLAEQASRQVLSLPMFPELTLEEQKQVASGLKDSISWALSTKT
jgi:dTDP-4-amino-4,6-dideoxygalactose transaminase